MNKDIKTVIVYSKRISASILLATIIQSTSSSCLLIEIESLDKAPKPYQLACKKIFIAIIDTHPYAAELIKKATNNRYEVNVFSTRVQARADMTDALTWYSKGDHHALIAIAAHCVNATASLWLSRNRIIRHPIIKLAAQRSDSLKMIESHFDKVDRLNAVSNAVSFDKLFRHSDKTPVINAHWTALHAISEKSFEDCELITVHHNVDDKTNWHCISHHGKALDNAPPEAIGDKFECWWVVDAETASAPLATMTPLSKWEVEPALEITKISKEVKTAAASFFSNPAITYLLYDPDGAQKTAKRQQCVNINHKDGCAGGMDSEVINIGNQDIFTPLCWHHAKKHRDNEIVVTPTQAITYLFRLGFERVAASSRRKAHEVSHVDICWWAMLNRVVYLLPSELIERSLNTDNKDPYFARFSNNPQTNMINMLKNTQ